MTEQQPLKKPTKEQIETQKALFISLDSFLKEERNGWKNLIRYNTTDTKEPASKKPDHG